MTPKMLEQAGTLLFGEYWRAPFCEKFWTDIRRLRRMLKGDDEITEVLARDIETALREHANRIDELLESMAA